MINYQLLEALAAIVSEKGFEKAARKLFITQSAASRRIRQLESIVGEPVLIRSHPPILTATGKRLLNHLQQVRQLEVALGMNTLVESEGYDQPLTIRLATNADSLATWLPEALAVGDKLKFELVVEDQSVTLKRMKAGEVMVCISSDGEPVNGAAVIPLGSLKYKVVASAKWVDRYGLDTDLGELPCLVFDENDKLQHQFLADFNYSAPQYIHYFPCSEGFKQGVLSGLGYGLLPELQIGDLIDRGELIDLKPDYVINTPLFWHYWHTESPQLKALREHAMSVAKIKLEQ
ncbi:LysR family transcriptional regulator ArgP [Alteromonas sp. 5E99-2]|uniref:LysR family transcriptional regulator ArgP n=1 Tax=Alteromonas sp. 5E99-2 TaxID=2817683 RepID=UPI001A98E7E0|nr:LysR family transcriptional regulator ArgP [Alteromonas sp. 5E99-2]MBO1254681.1 LysR family transcriptional regulator ArgP [Alteromonas sp. 5E99-2]